MSFDMITAITNVGFPIAMCVYFVLRFEKILSKNTEAITALTEKIKR